MLKGVQWVYIGVLQHLQSKDKFISFGLLLNCVWSHKTWIITWWPVGHFGFIEGEIFQPMGLTITKLKAYSEF